MITKSKLLISIFAAGVTILTGTACAQIAVPRTAPTSGRQITPADSANGPAIVNPAASGAPISLYADLGARLLTVQAGDEKVKTYAVAVGSERYPTPPGTYKIRKIIWNPSWRPPDSKWAEGKKAKGPGDPGNPMRVVKIFFREPDYYIHGTDDVESLGDAASHGCLRMAPDEVADLARFIMEHGGQPKDENWFWRIIHSRREEKVVYLDNPISLTVSN
jgi:lipoprotein-anchoring transpeptidase ErfK/SrfK